MRRLALCLSAVTVAAVSLAGPAPAQETGGEVCCEIIIIDGQSHVLYARYGDSGRVFQVRVSAEDIAQVRIGDMIGAELVEGGAVVTQVAGASRNYASVVPLSDDWNPNHTFDPSPDGWEPIQRPSGEFDVHQPDFETVCCPLAPNTELQGATGRLLVYAMEGVESFRVEVYKAGTTDRAADWYGNNTSELIPGGYDVVVNGVKLENVAIDRRSDTNIRLGALAINLSGNTRWEVYDASGENQYTDGYGSKTIVLPVGNYAIKMAGGVLEVEIKESQVTPI